MHCSFLDNDSHSYMKSPKSIHFNWSQKTPYLWSLVLTRWHVICHTRIVYAYSMFDKLPNSLGYSVQWLVLPSQLWYHTNSLLLQISAADVMKGTDTHKSHSYVTSCSPRHHLSEVVPPSEEHMTSSIIKRSTRLDSHQVDMIICPHYFIFVFLCRSVVKS